MSNSKTWKERTGLYWHQYKEIRAIILFEQDFSCGECGCLIGQKQADHHLHHLNGKPKNNNRGNLLVVCPQCHAVMHGFKADHFDRYQPLLTTEEAACPICARFVQLKISGLCLKCDTEHYSNYKDKQVI